MKRTILMSGLLCGLAVADGGNPCQDAYAVHVFPARELALQSVTLNGKVLDPKAAADFAISLPQEMPASHTVFPFRIFARTRLAEEDAGAQDSVVAFWLPDSILAERIRFVKSK